jgi:hypothetical protein
MGDNALKRIEQKILLGKYKEASFGNVPKSDRYDNRLYCIVKYSNVNFLCVFDKFENQIRTFLKPPSGDFCTMHETFGNIPSRR